MKWLVLCWAITAGYMPILQEECSTWNEGKSSWAAGSSVSVELEASAEMFGFLKSWGSVRTYNSFAGNLQLVPIRSDYQIGAALVAGPMELGIMHECVYGMRRDILDVSPLYQSGATMAYVKITGRSRP